MSETRSIDEILKDLGQAYGESYETAETRVREMLEEAYRSGQQNPSDVPVLTLVTDCINDGVAIEVNGQQQWWENSFDDIDQFFLHSPELLGRPVILQQRTDDESGE